MEEADIIKSQEEIELYQKVDAIKKTEAFRAVADAAAERAHWEHVLLKAKAHLRELDRIERFARRRLRSLLRDSVTVRSLVMSDEAMPKMSLFNKIALATGFAVLVVAVGTATVWSKNWNPIAKPAHAAEQTITEPEGEKIEEEAAPEATEAQDIQKTTPEAGMSRQEALVAFQAFTESNAPHLAGCAEHMVDHPRWVEALAISKQETSYCLAGVGRDNNCGGIKSHRADREFKTYATKCDGLEDIAFLIEKPRYAAMTIDEMNGTYCVDQIRPENRCESWHENIMRTVNEIRSALTNSRINDV